VLTAKLQITLNMQCVGKFMIYIGVSQNIVGGSERYRGINIYNDSRIPSKVSNVCQNFPNIPRNMAGNIPYNLQYLNNLRALRTASVFLNCKRWNKWGSVWIWKTNL